MVKVSVANAMNLFRSNYWCRRDTYTGYITSSQLYWKVEQETVTMSAVLLTDMIKLIIGDNGHFTADGFQLYYAVR